MDPWQPSQGSVKSDLQFQPRCTIIIWDNTFRETQMIQCITLKLYISHYILACKPTNLFYDSELIQDWISPCLNLGTNMG